MTLQQSRVPMSIATSVEAALVDVEKEHVKLYLEWIRDVSAGYTRAAHRSVFSCVITVLTFELLVASASSELTIGPVKLGESGLIVALLPAVAALFICQALVYELKQSRVFMISEITLKAWDSKIQTNDLGVFLVPPNPMHWNTSSALVVDGKRTPFDKVDNIASKVIFGILIIGMLVFFVHAFVYLFRSHEVDLVLTLASLVVVTFSCGLGVAYYAGARLTR